ncbi:MAG: DJ-1/PfpI family protein, partial [Chthoniobacterales bacterium]
MKRRHFLTTTAALAALFPAAQLLTPDEARAAEAKGISTKKSKLTPPSSGSISVAVAISEFLNVIDFSGPWGVFESVNLPNATEPPFRLFTVAEKKETVVSGSGLKLVPDYTFADVPKVNVIVVPAQKGSDALIDWLRKTAPTTEVTMSVCTGAFKLAKAGLLNGKAATTHHE